MRGGWFPRGLKPKFILMHLTYGLKPVPFKIDPLRNKVRVAQFAFLEDLPHEGNA